MVLPTAYQDLKPLKEEGRGIFIGMVWTLMSSTGCRGRAAAVVEDKDKGGSVAHQVYRLFCVYLLFVPAKLERKRGILTIIGPPKTCGTSKRAFRRTILISPCIVQ